MARVYNFSAGPSMLPESVLKKAAAEMLDYEAVVRALWKCHTAQKLRYNHRGCRGSFERGYEHS